MNFLQIIIVYCILLNKWVENTAIKLQVFFTEYKSNKLFVMHIILYTVHVDSRKNATILSAV